MTIPIAARHWWSFLLRGFLAILFGILTFTMPRMALFTLVFLFALWAVFGGVLSIAAAVQKTAPRLGAWWALLLSGLVGVLAGILALAMPGLTALSLLFLIAAWAIVTGVLEIVAAMRLRKEIEGEWLMVLSGALAVACGVLLMLFPGAGALAVALWIGAYAIVLGATLVALGVKLRRFAHPHVPHEPLPHPGH